MSQRRFQRFDRNQLRQHQFLMVSVLLLIGTGLPLRYADAPASQLLAQHLGGAPMAAFFHRLGAVGLIIWVLWHVLYLLVRFRRGSLNHSMVPAWKDVQDVWHQVLYLLGRRAEEPRFDRFNFIEKFEYWAMLWGSLVMIASGAILWFPVQAANLVQGVGIQLAKVVHGYEALLAALSILVWHMYHAHLRADVFPMNRVWLTGHLTEEEMRHHHPLELERLLAAEAATNETDGHDEHEESAAPLEPPADSDSVGGDAGGL